MKIQSLIVLLFLLPVFAHCQNNDTDNPNIEKSSFRRYLEKVQSDLHIENLEESEKEFCFRLVNTRHITEIWKNKKGKIEGQITSFIEKLPDSMDLSYLNNQTKKDYFIKIRRIKQRKSGRLYNKIQELEVEKIPNNKMPGQEIKDVGGYFMEITNTNSYSFKEFWILNDTGLQSENDKKVIQLVDYFNKEIDFFDIYERLIRLAPKGCYDLANGFNKCK